MKSSPPTSWNLKQLFENDSDPRIAGLRVEMKKAHVSFEKAWKKRTDYLTDPAILKEALDEYEALERTYAGNSKESYYFWLQSELDTSNAALKAAVQKTIDFSNELADHTRFFTQTISKIAKDKQSTFLKSPELLMYTHFLERLFASAAYLLSEPEERIMDLKSTSSHMRWVELTNGLFAREERVVETKDGPLKKSFSQISSLLSDSDKKTRDSAAVAINDIFATHAFVTESEINAVLGDKKVNDQIRGVARPDTLRHLDDDMETAAVDAMLATVESHFDIASRYYTLKASLLGLPKLAYHERNVEYGTVHTAYPYEKGFTLVRDVFADLDSEFATILDRFSANGQIDVYPTKGKSSGAFCAHNLLDDPTYILLNYDNKLVDVTVLAHEAGHGINNELARAKQHALYFETPTSTAEVASTFMEDFVIARLSQEMTEEERLSLLVSKLDNDISTIFRQVACYRFEQDLHAQFRLKGHLSSDEIGALFQKHMASYMGPSVEQSPGSQNWWMYWTHIRSYFYVYSYASGLLISKSLQAQVKKDPSFIANVKEFLATGSSRSPHDIFETLGIDINDVAFWEKGISEIEKRLQETEAVAKKLGKI